MHIARRTEYIRVMLTKEEKAILYFMARRSKMTVGKYVRSRIFLLTQEEEEILCSMAQRSNMKVEEYIRSIIFSKKKED